MYRATLDDMYYIQMFYFLRDRNAAMLSLDREKILEYARKWGVREFLAPREEVVWWGAVHMARTAIRTLPMAERKKSKEWLSAHGWRSLDDGEIV